jgi:hypothetical protein
VESKPFSVYKLNKYPNPFFCKLNYLAENAVLQKSYLVLLLSNFDICHKVDSNLSITGSVSWKWFVFVALQ